MKLPQTGELLQQKYKLQSVIGEGAFGVVYRATTISTGRVVAVKVLKPTDSGYDPIEVSRFLREMRTIAQLRSPHTLTLFDFGRTESGVLFMVCEYLPGEDLVDVLKRRQHLREHEAIHVMRQILLSLKDAHAFGVLHRDIKPHNIRISEYQEDPLRVTVFDFGLAKAWDGAAPALTADGRVVGTPRYMAPERLTGARLSPASDLFSVGMVAVELLVGREATSLEQRGGPLETPRLKSDSLNPVLVAVIHRMLELRPEDRFETASDVLAALDEVEGVAPEFFPEDDAVTQPNPPRTTEFERASRAGGPLRPSKVPALVAVLGAGLLAMGIVAFVAPSHAPEPEPTVRANLDRLVRATSPARQQARTTSDAGRSSDPGVVDLGAEDEAGDLGPQQAFAPGPRAQCHGLGPVKKGRHRLGEKDGPSTHYFVPATYDPALRSPVVMVFSDQHQDAGTALKMLLKDSDDADRLSPYVVIAPRANPLGLWTPDVVKDGWKALDQLEEVLCLDRKRVFLIGIGIGGHGVYQSMSRPVVAAATTAYRSGKTTIFPTAHVPYLHFAPTRDRRDPIDGGGNCVGWDTVSLDEHNARFLEAQRCHARPRSVDLYPEAKCVRWACAEPYTSCRVEGGRPWKNGASAVPFCASEPVDFSYQKRIWQFFADVEAGVITSE